MEWGELATHMGISRSMLDFVRKGQRNLSFPALRRLEECERQAGLAPAEIVGPHAQKPESSHGKNAKLSSAGHVISERDAAMGAAISRAIEALQDAQRLLNGES